MKAVDVWAYGMIVFNLINPDLSHPFQRDFDLSAAATTLIEKLKKMLSEENKPCFAEKYKHLQEPIGQFYKACTMTVRGEILGEGLLLVKLFQIWKHVETNYSLRVRP